MRVKKGRERGRARRMEKEYCETEEEKILVNINSGICMVQVLESGF